MVAEGSLELEVVLGDGCVDGSAVGGACCALDVVDGEGFGSPGQVPSAIQAVYRSSMLSRGADHATEPRRASAAATFMLLL